MSQGGRNKHKEAAANTRAICHFFEEKGKTSVNSEGEGFLFILLGKG
jgi:hypothetical protein